MHKGDKSQTDIFYIREMQGVIENLKIGKKILQDFSKMRNMKRRLLCYGSVSDYHLDIHVPDRVVRVQQALFNLPLRM
jgi:hypothetical protein